MPPTDNLYIECYKRLLPEALQQMDNDLRSMISEGIDFFNLSEETAGIPHTLDEYNRYEKTLSPHFRFRVEISSRNMYFYIIMFNCSLIGAVIKISYNMNTGERIPSVNVIEVGEARFIRELRQREIDEELADTIVGDDIKGILDL
jgi:hypothetical protein